MTGLPRRTLLVVLVTASLAAAASSYSDLYAGKYLGGYQLAPGAVGLFGILLLGSALIRRRSSGKGLGRGELLLVYSVLTLAVLFGGMGGEGAFLPSLVYPFYFANEGNRLTELVQPHTPSWLVPGHVASSARWFFEGMPRGAGVPWRDWVPPLLVWSVLLLALYGAMAAIALLVFERWTKHERLRFPLAEVPLAMAGGEGRRTWLLWIGVAVAAGLGLAQGLPAFLPTFPQLSLRWSFPPPGDRPWSVWGHTILNLSPAVIGLSYLISSEVCLSLVAFHFLFRLMNVAGAAAGLPIETEQDYWAWKEYQALFCFGGYVGFAGMTLLPLLRRASTGGSRSPAVLLGFSLLVVAAWLKVIGLSAGVVFAAVAVYLVFAVVLTRVVCEMGLFLIQPPILPTDILGAFGMATRGADAALFSFVMPSVLFELRGFALPGILHGLKLTGEARVPLRWYLIAVLAALPLVMAVAHATHLSVFYHRGALQCANVWMARAQAGTGFDHLAQRASAEPGVQWARVGWIGLGVGGVLFLQQLRTWLLWFPLNPIGMVMGVSYPSMVLWGSLAAGGVLKAVLARWGGKRAHDAGKTLAVGLVLGHVAVTLFWYALDLLAGTSIRPSGLE